MAPKRERAIHHWRAFTRSQYNRCLFDFYKTSERFKREKEALFMGGEHLNKGQTICVSEKKLFKKYFYIKTNISSY